MEPWDGPAAIAFTDGTVVGAQLDRNGFRPLRYWVTDDDLVVMASEVGVLDLPASKVVLRGRIQPGRMFLVDTAAGRIVDDDEIKDGLAAEHPYEEWLAAGRIDLEDLPLRRALTPQYSRLVSFQRQFGYTEEEIRLVFEPMVRTGAEPVASMGDDTPLAVLSRRPRLLYDYFRQLFAQVTNPPLDAIREELITSLSSSVGPEGNLLAPGPQSCHQIMLPGPVLTNDELATLLYVDEDGLVPGWRTFAVDGLFAAQGEATSRASGCATPSSRVCAQVEEAILGGASVVVLSDRHANADAVPVPCLLLVSAVHHYLVDKKLRTRVGLIVETGEARAVHHVACLISYGAAAVNPYLAFDTVVDQVRRGAITGMSDRKALRQLREGAQQGRPQDDVENGHLDGGVVHRRPGLRGRGPGQRRGRALFPGDGHPGRGDRPRGDSRRSAGPPPAGLARAAERARPPRPRPGRGLAVAPGGRVPPLQPRDRLQAPARHPGQELQDLQGVHARRRRPDRATWPPCGGCCGFRPASETGRKPVPLDEVEPVSEIVKRFATGAMSYGAISQEAHETLAIAMNRLGASPTAARVARTPSATCPTPTATAGAAPSARWRRAVSGSPASYLVNADDIQIKMAQGAKPGEGGQLPGKKVYPWIAKTRYSTPGVGLISPPPHHDIYSIEDLAQLIYDLKNANPRARINVKLVAETGVGTVAAGRGQGARRRRAHLRPRRGHRGFAHELHQARRRPLGARAWPRRSRRCCATGCADRVVLQVDGSMKTGRDVVVAALLGAEEYGFSTAPLVVEGCIMMRVCHLDTCPVGVATQNPELRKRFSGTPDLVVNFFEFIAEEVRELLAEIGFRTLEEAIGHAELLEPPWPPPTTPRPPTLDLSAHPVPAAGGCAAHLRAQAGPRPRAHPGRQADRGLPGRPWTMAAAVSRLVAGGQLQPRRRHHARLRGDPPLRGSGLAAGHHRARNDRLGRPELRRLPAPGRDAAPVRRRQRLPGQGAVGRAHRGAAAGGRAGRFRGRGQHNRRQRDRLRRHQRGDLHPRRRRASAFASAIRAPWPSSRAWATTVAST